MKKFVENEKGQFVIIAFLMIAIMIISIGAMMHKAVTYYKHEPWEEYLTLVGGVELNSRRIVELSLANYTCALNTNISEANSEILKSNLDKWQGDLGKIYPGYGAVLIIESSNLTCDWNKPASFSRGTATFTLNITSIGLRGYEFIAETQVNLRILGPPSQNEINVTVTLGDGAPLRNLKADNFQVNGIKPTDVTSRYHNATYTIIYRLTCVDSISQPVIVNVWDLRGILVTAEYS